MCSALYLLLVTLGTKLRLFPERPNHTFDPLIATAAQLQNLLSSGKLTSVELCQVYLDQIHKHDHYLKAVLAIASTALSQAAMLDKERLQGRVRGPLHGIPVLIKDNIATLPTFGMDTTAGSLALTDSKPARNAEIIDRMVTAGLIILAKAQLSEFANFKGSNLMAGWSAVGGQTQSAYTSGDVDLQDSPLGHSSPSGSSTGSAVGVSAGYSPLAVGTDTCGSLITPSTRAALFTIRPTIGTVSQEGIIPVSKLFDTAGPMAKSVVDLANLLDVLIDSSKKETPGTYAEALPGKWSELRVGVLDPDEWFFDENLQKPVPAASEQIRTETRKAYQKFKKLAKEYREISLISPDKLIVNNEHSMYALWNADFREHINEYLGALEWSKVRTLDDLIKFNKENAAEELPSGFVPMAV
ncbi:hypothetical protein MMC15_007983 [Xylographa vitiligo]|nr:hypothetical protein [Xylographa vitiligo]